MTIVAGADHAGVELKGFIIEALRKDGYQMLDVGTNDLAPVDYPDIARLLCNRIIDGSAERGIIVCGSGVGACIAANKIKGIHAGICHDTYSAHQGVEHDAMNVLCLGGRVVGAALAIEIARAFAGAVVSTEERHVRRVGKIREIEAGKR